MHSPKKWFLLTCICLALTLVSQFFIFRYPAIYNLCLKSYLYNHHWWVEKPAKHLVLGSSNAMNAIIPSRISQLRAKGNQYSLNLGLNGTTPFHMHHNLTQYAKKFPFPNEVDIVITPLMLTEYLYYKLDYEKIWLKKEQWNLLEKNEGITNSYFFPAMLFYENLHFDHLKIFKEYHFNLNQTRSNRGFQPIPEGVFKKEDLSENFPHISQGFSWAHQQINYLKKIKELSKQHNTQVRYILTPLHQDLYNYYSTHKHTLLELDRLLKETLGDITYLGSFNPQKFKLEEKHFINPDHLTINGARLFTNSTYGQHPITSKFIIE